MNFPAKPDVIDLAREADFALGALQVRPAAREAINGATRELLEPRVMQVLVALYRRHGMVVSRDELIMRCWAGRAVSDDAINRCTGAIRKLASSHGGFVLETVPRIGYRLVEIGARPPAETEAAPPPGSAAIRWRPRALIAAIVLALAAVGAALWFARPPAKLLTVRAPVRQAIAVLPFTPLSGDPDIRSFGDSVATAVAEALNRIGQPVVPPAESFRFRGAAKAGAARELKAMYVVDGEVRRKDGRVRISVRLDDAVHGKTVFAHSFDEPERRAPALPDRVAAYVAALSWGYDITGWDTRFAPTILRASEQHKRGDRFAAYQTVRALAKAEPDDAHIQGVYASYAVDLLYADTAVRNPGLIAEARAAANRALRLDPNSSKAYAALASATPHFLWAEREAYLNKARAADPDSVGVTEYMTWFLNDVGRTRDAAPTARSAYERFPYHPLSHERQIEQLLGAGGGAAIRRILPDARRLWPDHAIFLALSFEESAFGGTPAAAADLLAEPETARLLPANRLTLWRQIVRALQSRRPADIATVSRGCADAGEDWWSCMIALTMLGRQDQAYRIADAAYPDQRAATAAALLEKWLSNKELPLTRYLFVPATAPLRADPRFHALVERVGLMRYWRTAGAPDFCASERVPVCRLLNAP